MASLRRKHQYWQNNPRIGVRLLESLESKRPTSKSPIAKEHQKTELVDIQQCLFPDVHEDNGADDDADRAFPMDFALDRFFPTNFSESYDLCKFDHGLTALEYLQDMESARLDSLRKAANRLGLRRSNFQQLIARDSTIKYWVMAVEQQSLVVGRLFATSFVSFRTWVILHEITSAPMYKPNAIALLNTLFPPDLSRLPSEFLSINDIENSRWKMWRLMNQVDNNPEEAQDLILDPASSERLGIISWPETYQSFIEYFKLSRAMISEASSAGTTKKDANLSLETDEDPMSQALALICNPSEEKSDVVKDFLALGRFIRENEVKDMKKTHLKLVAELTRQASANAETLKQHDEAIKALQQSDAARPIRFRRGSSNTRDRYPCNNGSSSPLVHIMSHEDDGGANSKKCLRTPLFNTDDVNRVFTAPKSSSSGQQVSSIRSLGANVRSSLPYSTPKPYSHPPTADKSTEAYWKSPTVHTGRDSSGQTPKFADSIESLGNAAASGNTIELPRTPHNHGNSFVPQKSRRPPHQDSKSPKAEEALLGNEVSSPRDAVLTERDNSEKVLYKTPLTPKPDLSNQLILEAMYKKPKTPMIESPGRPLHGTSSVRRTQGYQTTLPDTPEVPTPPGNEENASNIIPLSEVSSEITPASLAAALPSGTPQFLKPLQPDSATTDSVQKSGNSSSKNNEGTNSTSTGLGIVFGKKNTSKASPGNLRGSIDTFRDLPARHRRPNKTKSLINLFSSKTQDLSALELSELPKPPFCNQSANQSTTWSVASSVASSRGSQKSNERFRHRHRFTGDLLVNVETSSNSAISLPYQGSVNERIQSSDIASSRRSLIDMDRSHSTSSLFTARRRSESHKSRTSSNEGKEPATPKRGKSPGRKHNVFRSPRSSGETVYTGDDHPPLPVALLHPFASHFPSRASGETNEQSQLIEELRRRTEETRLDEIRHALTKKQATAAAAGKAEAVKNGSFKVQSPHTEGEGDDSEITPSAGGILMGKPDKPSAKKPNKWRTLAYWGELVATAYPRRPVQHVEQPPLDRIRDCNNDFLGACDLSQDNSLAAYANSDQDSQ